MCWITELTVGLGVLGTLAVCWTDCAWCRNCIVALEVLGTGAVLLEWVCLVPELSVLFVVCHTPVSFWKFKHQLKAYSNSCS